MIMSNISKKYITQLFISDYYVEIFKYVKNVFKKHIERKRIKKILKCNYEKHY